MPAPAPIRRRPIRRMTSCRPQPIWPSRRTHRPAPPPGRRRWPRPRRSHARPPPPPRCAPTRPTGRIFRQWCAAHGFIAAPAAPATVGAYLASLAGSHAPTTIRRRLAALGKMHRFNDLAWNPGHHAIQGPLRGVLRTHGRPVQKAAALTLPMLRQMLGDLRPERARPA